MPGFFITNEKNASTAFRQLGTMPLLHDDSMVDGWVVSRDVLDRFGEHKVFFEDADILVMTDGIITNAHHLGVLEHPEGLGGWIRDQRETDPLFFKRFCGSFSGAIWDRKAKEWTIYTSPTGDRAVFYWLDPEKQRVIVGSQMNFVTDTMKRLGIPRVPDEQGLKNFLNFGFFTDTHTGVQGVRRLYPGDYLCLRADFVETKSYITFAEKNLPDKNIDEAITSLHEVFLSSLEDGVFWNQRHGYTGLVDLSGGADTRIIFFALQHLAPKSFETLTYAQKGSRDHTIAKQIAQDANTPWHFMPLDSPRFLTEVDTLMLMNNGVSYYFGITGGKQMLENLTSSYYGIEWTGIAGDIHEGAMLTENAEQAPQEKMERYRLSRYFPLFPTKGNEEIGRFSTNDRFWFFTRGFLAAASTNFIRQYYTEPLMPLADSTFLQVLFDIPWKQRVYDKIQMRWLKREFPESIKYLHSGTGLPLSREFYPWHVIERKIHTALSLLRAKRKGKPITNDMNPLDYWWNTEDKIREELIRYYRDSVSAIQNEEMQGIVRELFEQGAHFVDRGLALSIISYYKNYLD